MAVKTNISSDVINRYRDESTIDLAKALPLATADADVIKQIGKIIIDSPNLQNEFSSWLINRIAKSVIWSGAFKNPLSSVFDKGAIEYGDVIEEVFVDLCRPYQYSESKAERNVFARVSANLKSSFHMVNCYIYYKQTINRAQIQKAFLSVDGIEALISTITASMIQSFEYDDYQMYKYQIAKAALSGILPIVPVSAVTSEATGKALVKNVKEYSNKFQFLNRDYNACGVANNVSKENQFFLVDAGNDATLDVDVLSYMFGVEYSRAGNKKITLDNFDDLDIDRLRYIMCPKDPTTGEPIDDPTSSDFEPFTSDELAALQNIEGVLVDQAFFQNYTQLFETTDIINPEGLSRNMWLHVWRCYSISPFADCVIFGSGSNTVTVAIDDSDVPTVKAGTGGSKTIDVEVTTSGLVPKGAKLVKWSVTTSQGATGEATIDQAGKLTWSDDFTAADTITIKCESVNDATVYDTATITVGAAG